MLILFAIGMPISFAMAFAGVASYAYLVSPEVGFSVAGMYLNNLLPTR